MKKLLLLITVYCLSIKVFPQNYSASTISDSIKLNADAVKRFEEIKITIKNIGKAIINHKYVYTVLNESGDRFAFYSEYYNKFRTITDISGNLYDALGIKIKSIKKKDIADASLSDGFSLISDTRTKYFSFHNKSYPYTIEFEDEIELNGILNLPTWLPINTEGMSVVQSKFIVETPIDYQLRYKEINYNGKPIIQIDNNKIVYSWETNNLEAIESELFQPEWRNITTSVIIAPTNFEYGGFTGSMANWKDYGKFQIALNNNRDILPENIKKEIHQITDNLISWKEKVIALYEYLQKNTRYISVQLGIGGLQPFEAKYVAEKKYGDCKALSNYMVSILKEVGIKSYFTLIAGGEDERKSVISDFTRDYFNHVITCVPNGNDTIWLECTSQTKSAGYMGKFTGGRAALLIGDDGGYLVNTPNYWAIQNTQYRTIEANIQDDGTLVAEVKTIFSGIQQELQHNLIHDFTAEARKKYLNNYIKLPTYNIDKSEYKEIKSAIPTVIENLKITSPNYANVTGKRLFIIPNLINKGEKLPNIKPRKFDIEYDYAFTDVDSILIKIPKGFSLESAPKNLKISNVFGEYSMEFKIENEIIQVVRKYIRNQGKYPASAYESLVKFYDEIYKADKSKIVLIKNE